MRLPRFVVPTLLVSLALTGLATAPAVASFHFMQIEQVTAAACGSSSLQAVQLRMRFNGQNLVGGARLVAHDAAGANPVEIIDFPSDVTNGSQGDRVLVVSPALASSLPDDFQMTNLIPASYLAAGRLTFESAGGVIYWSVAWGGADYTGSTLGNSTNDDDGDFGPPFDAPLPSFMAVALAFQGAASAQSTSNSADYVFTADGAAFTGNSGATGSLPGGCAIFADGFESGNTSGWSTVTGGT